MPYRGVHGSKTSTRNTPKVKKKIKTLKKPPYTVTFQLNTIIQ